MNADTTTWTVGGDSDNNLPAWVRTVIVTGGELFVPAAIGGDEAAIALSASVEGEPTIAMRGHAFVRLPWLVQECSSRLELVELLDLIELRISDALAGRLDARHGSQSTSGEVCYGP